MKYLLSIIFLLVFSFAAYSQQISCNYTVTFEKTHFPASGGTINYTIVYSGDSIGKNCARLSPTGTSDWLLYGRVSPNSGPARTGTLRFYDSISDSGRLYSIGQESGCTYSLENPYAFFGSSGGSAVFYKQNSLYECGYGTISVSNNPFITIDANSDGLRTFYTVAPNAGAMRTGTITANFPDGARTLTVNQAAVATPTPTPTPVPIPSPTVTPSPTPTPSCTYALGTLSQSFTANGGAGSVDVQTQAGCAYSAAASNSFVTITNPNSTGNGTVSFTIAGNTGAARTGTLFIAGQIFTVNQAAGKSRKRILP